MDTYQSRIPLKASRGTEQVDSNQLNAWQVQRLLAVVVPHLGFLHRVLGRMDQRHVPIDDPLRIKTTAAYNALHSLRVTLHYMECEASKREAASKGASRAAKINKHTSRRPMDSGQ